MTPRTAALEAAVALTDELDRRARHPRKDTTMSMPAHDHEEASITRLTVVPTLDEILAGDDPDFDTDPEPPIDVDQADRWLYRLRLLNEHDNADLELANTQKARIDLWLSLQQATRAKTRQWLEASLALHHEAYLRTAGPKAAKTMHLPNGDLIARAQQPEWRYTDEAAMVAWAQANERDELLTHPKPVPDKNAVKRMLAPPAAVLDSLDAGTELDVLDAQPCPTCDPDDTDERCDQCGGSGHVFQTVPGITILKRADKITVVVPV